MFLLSAEYLKKIVINAVGSSYNIENYSLEPFFPAKIGTFATHNLLKVSVKKVHNSVENCKVLTFFIKSLPESNVIQDIMGDMTFEEVNFYKNIKPLMLVGHESERWAPKCYLAENNVLVFEDLRAQGFSMNSEAVMDKRLLKSALASVARFHASTLVAESKLGKPLNKAFPNFLSEKTFDGSKKIGQATILGFKTIVLMAEKLHLDASFVLPNIYDYVYEAVKPQEGELNVLCHNDLWNNNLLFNQKDVPECIIVDYQLLRYATSVADLSLFVYSTTTPEFRIKFEHQMVHDYYCIFQETVAKSNVQVKIPTIESFLKTYKKYRLIGMVSAVINAPIKKVELGQVRKLVDDPKAMERYILYDRMEIIGPYLENSPTFIKEMKELLCEVLNEGKRVLNL